MQSFADNFLQIQLLQQLEMVDEEPQIAEDSREVEDNSEHTNNSIFLTQTVDTADPDGGTENEVNEESVESKQKEASECYLHMLFKITK